MGFFGWLTVAFVVLKLVGYFPYSWWLVFAPVAVGFFVFLGTICILTAIKVIAER